MSATSGNEPAEGIPNRELVVYTLSLLGGGYRRVHTEDIAVKCFELFPASFSWTKYEQYPDKDIVRVALTDARKERYGGLVKGRAGQKRGHSAKTRRAPAADGWILTLGGIEFVRENEDRLAAFGESAELKEHRQRVLQQLGRVRRHVLYRQFNDDPRQFAPSIGKIADLLRCRVDAEQTVWDSRFEGVRRLATAADKPAVLEFIKRCEKAYLEQR